MKILIVNTFYSPTVIGGAEISVQHLSEELAREGHEIVVVCLGSQAATEIINDVRVYRVPLFNIYFPFRKRPGVIQRLVWNILDIYNPVMARRVKRIIKIERPDVIHTNILLGFSCSIWKTVHMQRIKLVHTIRDHSLICPRSTMYRNGKNCTKQCLSCRIFSFTKKRMSSHVSQVIGISSYILNRHREAGYFPGAQEKVIHNSFRRESYGIDRKKRASMRFGYIGRIAAEKGVGLLIDAFLELGDDTATELILAGNGEENYVEQMKQKAQGANIKFLGFTERADFYENVDIVVVPSVLHEALGRAVLEAYSYGLPVVASKRGGIPEIVDQGRTGLLFDPGVEGDLLKTLVKSIDMWRNNQELAAACLLKSKEFTEGAIAKQYTNAYQDRSDR